MSSRRALAAVTSAAIIAVVGALSLHGAAITVPNGSFESPSAAGQVPPVNIFIGSWQKAPKPAYFDEAAYGFLWIQTAGVFVDTNPYANHDGTQAAYLLPFPQVALFQELTTPDAIYAVGSTYSFTLGVFGKGITDGSTLQLSFYYRDALDTMVTVGTPTTVTYTAAGFPVTSPLNLFDFSASLPEVQSSDAWAGKNIGLKIESTFGTGAGNWDIDNARLIATPVSEPAVLTLMAAGLGGWVLVRARSRKV